MKAIAKNRIRRAEAGIALLISIFVLLLICVVAIALVVSSGTESALAGNYRSSTGVYYAALSGLEEARGRLLSKNPDAFTTTNPANFLPAPGAPLAIGTTYYLINPVGGEAITPWDSSSTYPDTEFRTEFGVAPTNPSRIALSVWNRNPLLALNLPGPYYKWVRINAVSELSLNLDTSPYDGVKDPTPVYYDGVHLNDTSNGAQVLELTAFAVLPNGSQKILQYLVVPTPVQIPPLPAALTLAGSVGGTSATVAYSSPNSNTLFKVLGVDQDCNGNPTGNNVPAIGVLNSTDIPAVITGGNGGNGIKPAYVANPPNNNYLGHAASPDVETVNSSFSSSMLTPAGLDAAVQSITQNADAVITGTATGSNLTALGMSSSNLMTVVVNGDLDLSNWSNDGYGLILVTGTFTYDPDTNWNGIVLVIGQGIVNNTQHGQYKQINGALFVSQTRNPSNQLLPGPNLGGASVIFDPPMQGNGIRYSSCWIQRAMPTANYKILSFHEISQ